jgi:5-(carboxyamino)imidazole ribonucleotide mutase
LLLSFKEKNMAKKQKSPHLRVGIIMGSDSDLRVMKDASKMLSSFDVEHEVRIISAHRTPDAMIDYAASAEARGLQVIIAGAGGSAHLPGMVAAATLLPVIGVPVNVTKLHGLDSLLSIVQMPKGVPVAAVAIDNSANAGLLAVRILANSDPRLRAKLFDYRRKQARKVIEADKTQALLWGPRKGKK